MSNEKEGIDNMAHKQSILRGMGWKLLERFSVQGIQFVLQIILARLLGPEHYGVLAVMLIFVNLADVFVQSGFSMALIQNKEVEEDDFSAVFWVSLVIASVIYVILFLTAPIIESFYSLEGFIGPFRVICLMLFPGVLSSVLHAKVTRNMDFRTIFFSTFGSVVFSGLIGVVIAFMGGGLWALVAQTLTNAVVSCAILRLMVRWKLRWKCNWSRIKILFSYGWKLLVSNLLETLYQDLSSLVIGKKYSSDMLAYYNRGKQFPNFIINAVNGAVKSVMLPAMASDQDDKEKVKNMMRYSITLSSFVVFPVLFGLAGVATPMVQLLLTDEWLPCVPYVQIFCFNLCLYPVHSCNLQAINAMGRSDIFLKLEIIKKILGLGFLLSAVIWFDSPIAIAATGIPSTIINCFVNARPNKKLVGYSYLQQMKDILPSLMIAIVMFCCVLSVELLRLSAFITLLLQIFVGVIVYTALSALLHLEPFGILLDMLKKVQNK